VVVLSLIKKITKTPPPKLNYLAVCNSYCDITVIDVFNRKVNLFLRTYEYYEYSDVTIFARVLSVVDEDNILVTFFRGGEVYLIKGVKVLNRDYVDGEVFGVTFKGGYYELKGTYTYTTAIGSSKTVRVIQIIKDMDNNNE